VRDGVGGDGGWRWAVTATVGGVVSTGLVQLGLAVAARQWRQGKVQIGQHQPSPKPQTQIRPELAH